MHSVWYFHLTACFELAIPMWLQVLADILTYLNDGASVDSYLYSIMVLLLFAALVVIGQTC